MTRAVTLSDRGPARCACGLPCLALALLLFALVMPTAATASVSTGAAVLSSVLPSRATDLPAGAVIELGTVDWTRTSSYDGWNWAIPDLLDYYTDTAGNLAIVAHDATAGTLSIETYDPSTLQRIGDTRSISLAGWPDWGGFYAGPDGCFYVLVGRENPNEDDTLDVVAVRRYDGDWTLVGTAYVQGGANHGVKGIYSPFAFSASHMVLVGNRLVVHMGRLIYAHEGVHHQGNLTFEVDVDTMAATPFDQLGGIAYSSHSFQQLVAMSGSNLVMIDHGDAYPRAIQMGVMAGYPSQRQVSSYRLFEFNGAIGDNFTGATVTGLVSGPSGIVVVGNSIRHPDAPNGALGSAAEHRNIYAIWADPATGAHTVRWLTDFSPQGADVALEPRVVRVGPDRYAVLFSVRSDGGYRMEYRLIDSAGAVLASTFFPGAFFCAVSEPILIGGNVYWVGIEPDSWSPPAPAYLFEIDVSDPTRPFLLDRTPPTTTASGASATAWYRTTRTITFTATDNEGGSGVAKTEFKLDSGDWTTGTSVIVTAPASHENDGSHTVTYRSTDAAGNVEDAKTSTVNIDTVGPITYAKAASGRVGRSLRLRYKATDDQSSRVRKVRLVVKNARGRTVKTFRIGELRFRVSGVWYSFTWKPKARGTYRYRVYAEDTAGNRQRRVGSAKVFVK